MRSDSVGIAKQTVVGTKVTTPEYYVPVESATFESNHEIQTVEESVGHRFPTDMDVGTEFFGVTMAGKARAGSFPRILSGFLGAPTTSTPGTGVKLHTFTPVSAAPVPHSLKVSRVDPSTPIIDLAYDAYGNQLTTSVAVNDWLSFDANWVAAANDDTQTAPTVTLDTTPRFNFDECKAYISVNGGSESEVKVANWSMTYSNNFETDNFVLGQRNLYALNSGNASAEFSFTIKEALNTHYRRALMATPDNIKLRLTATGSIIASALPFQFEVIAYKLNYLSAPAAVSATDRLTGIEVTARAAYDTSTSKFVEVSVQNAVTSY